MPDGKPAGTACVQLTETNLCAIFGQPERPNCCAGLMPSKEMCGTSRQEAMRWLAQLEAATKP
jgi:hypothetical protein